MSPRLSIIRGDFPEDQRADVGHFRVYTLIGRHTDAHGWCRLKQITIGNEVGLSRKTVNLKLRDLVEWGYVEKRETDATGRAIWYRTILDGPAPPPAVADDEPEARASEASNENAPVTGALQVGCNTEATCNRHRVTPGVTTRGNTERPLLNDSPPLPPDGGDSGKPGNGQWKAEALAALRAAGRYREAVEALLAPLLASDKRLSLGRGPAVLEALTELAQCAHGIPRPALEAAAGRLIASEPRLTPRHIRDEIDRARQGGAMVVVRPGMPQWARWIEHYQTSDPRRAETMLRVGVWQVPSEWPPAKSATPEARGAA